MDDPEVERKGNMGVVVHRLCNRAFVPPILTTASRAVT